LNLKPTLFKIGLQHKNEKKIEILYEIRDDLLQSAVAGGYLLLMEGGIRRTCQLCMKV